MEKERTYTIDEILKEAEEKRARKEREQQEAKEKLAREIKEIVEGTKEDNQEEVVQTQSMGTPSKSEEQDEVEESIFKDEEKQKIELQRKTLGTNQEGLNKATKSNKRKIATVIGVVSAIGIIALIAKGCSHDKNQDKTMESVTTSTSASTTTTVTTEETKEFITTTQEEKVEETTITVDDTTLPVSETTITVDDTTLPVEEQPVSETTQETVNPADLIVTTPQAQNTVITEETTITSETTVAEETTKAPKTTEEQLIVTELPQNIIKPVVVKNLDTKTDELINSVKNVHVFGDRKSYENVVRIFNSDFTEHDGYEEIRSLNLDNYLVTFLCNIGSNNAFNLNCAYLGIIKEVNDIVYLPESLFPENTRKIIREFNKYTKEYVNELNSNQFDEIEMDYDYFQKQYIEKEQQYLDDYQELVINGEKYIGIMDFDRYLQLLEKLVNGKLEEEQEQYEMFVLSENFKAQQKRQNAYYKYFNQVSSLMKTKEYSKIGSAKMGLLTSVIPALISGLDTDTIDGILPKYENIAATVVDSVDDIRYMVVTTNREYNLKNEGKTIDLNEVLEAYVEQATQITAPEAEMLDEIFNQIKNKNESKVKTY